MNIDDHRNDLQLEADARRIQRISSPYERMMAYKELKERIEHSKQLIQRIEDRCDEFNQVIYRVQDMILDDEGAIIDQLHSVGG